MADENKLGLAELDLEKFRIFSRDEVLRVLRDLARDHQLVSLYFNEGQEFLLTTLLGVDERQGQLLLDYGADGQVNRRLLEHSQAIAVSSHRHVRVQFRLEGITRLEFEGSPAFLAPLPASLVRVQRREFYRIPTPAASRLRCSFRTEEGLAVEAPVLDISIGGVGLIEPGAGSFPWEPGTVIRDVRVDLPGGDLVIADMEIRNRFPVEKGNSRQFRVGCMFLHLDNRQSAAIQRYIHRTELERRRILQG